MCVDLLAMKKYILVDNIPRVNELYAEGYRVHTAMIEHYNPDHATKLMARPMYLMSYQEPSKYDDMLAFKKIPITVEEQPIPEGWKAIHHTAKEMVLKRVEPDE